MIIRHRKRPLPLQKLDIAISRMNEHHEKYILLKRNASIYLRGYRGEQRLDYFLKLLPTDFSIMNDVTLKARDITYQIDSLIISDYGIFIIDVKNFRNTITFNTTLRQLTQSDGNITKTYQYPMTQLENIQLNLTHWLDARNLNDFPIHNFIIRSQEHP